MPDEITDADIVAAALAPKKVDVDGVSVEMHSLADLKAVKDDLEEDDALNTPKRGLRITRLVPPGTYC